MVESGRRLSELLWVLRQAGRAGPIRGDERGHRFRVCIREGPDVACGHQRRSGTARNCFYCYYALHYDQLQERRQEQFNLFQTTVSTYLCSKL